MRLRGPESYSDDPSVELAMRRAGGREVLVELRRAGGGLERMGEGMAEAMAAAIGGRLVFVCCECGRGASLDVTDSSSPRRREEWWELLGDTRPGCRNCCWA